MKRNLNMPGFKLKHMNTPLLDKKSLPEARKEKTPVKPTNILTADKRPSFLHNNGVVSSSGGLTPSEKAEANRLLDSVKGTYMDRKFKQGRLVFEDGKPKRTPEGGFIREQIPVSPEQNLKEYEMEKGGYYVDFTKGGKAVVKGVPSGDDDIPVQSFIKSLDPSQYRGSFMEDLPKDYQDPGLIEGHPLNPFEGYQRVENYRNR